MSRVFNGANAPSEQYVYSPTSAVYNNLTALTIAMWVFPTDDTIIFGVLAVKDPTGSYDKAISLCGVGSSGAQGTLFATVGATGVSNSNEMLSLNAWSHVAMTWDSAGDQKIHIYINGVEVSYALQIVTTTEADDSGDGWWAGNDSFDDGYVGRLSDFRIYNVALTGGQIATLAGGGNPAAANLVAEWLLCGTQSPEPDSSGNGNSMVLNNAPAQGPNPPLVTGCGSPPPSSGGFGGVGDSRWMNGARDFT